MSISRDWKIDRTYKTITVGTKETVDIQDLYDYLDKRSRYEDKIIAIEKMKDILKKL